MKNISRFFIISLLSIVSFSCSEDYFDVNENQNAASSSTPELSLPVAQLQSQAYLSGDYGSLNTLGNIWSYSWAAAGDAIYFTEETKYNVNAIFRGFTFTGAYLGALNNYKVVEDYTDSNYDNFRAIAKIMKAFHYQYLVDAYGDVPYSEALKKSANNRPKYDNAQTIYNDLIIQLTQAQQLIAGTNAQDVVPTVNQDIMCGGNMAKWARFANTLKLRILLRQTPKNSSVNFTPVTGNSIGFLGANETVYTNPGYVNEANKQNPLYAAFGKTVAGDAAANSFATRGTNYAITKLNSDPRRRFLFQNVGTNLTSFVGIAQNNPGGPASSALSGVGPGILKGSNQNGIIMQGAESLLLQAEAVARGISIPGVASTLYDNAIQASFDELGAGNSSAYRVLFAYPNGSLSQNVEAIIYQKWVALMGTNGFENWVEYRRTGFPTGLPVSTGLGVLGAGLLPVRLAYPSSEIANNGENVPVVGSNFTSKVFWQN